MRVNVKDLCYLYWPWQRQDRSSLLCYLVHLRPQPNNEHLRRADGHEKVAQLRLGQLQQCQPRHCLNCSYQKQQLWAAEVADLKPGPARLLRRSGMNF